MALPSFESLLDFFGHQGFRGLAIQALQALRQGATAGAAAHGATWLGCGMVILQGTGYISYIFIWSRWFYHVLFKPDCCPAKICKDSGFTSLCWVCTVGEMILGWFWKDSHSSCSKILHMVEHTTVIYSTYFILFYCMLLTKKLIRTSNNII